MKNTDAFKTDIEKTIRSLFHHTKYTKAEKKLLANGWKKEGPYWVDRSEKDDIYGLLLRGINPANILYPKPAKIC